MATKTKTKQPKLPTFSTPKQTQPAKPKKGKACRAAIGAGMLAAIVSASGCAATQAAVATTYPQTAQYLEFANEAIDCLDHVGPPLVSLVNMPTDDLVAFIATAAALTANTISCFDKKEAVRGLATDDETLMKHEIVRAEVTKRLDFARALVGESVKRDAKVKPSDVVSPAPSQAK